MLRIIAGRYKGRRISMPRGIRPTRDNVREAVFNVISGHIGGSRVLDLFAGSGSFGIEAISRGASYVVFADNATAKTIEKNLNRLCREDTADTRVISKDAAEAIKLLRRESAGFDIIFLDPPYYKGWVKKCLKYFSIYDILSNSGLIIAEHFKKDPVPAEEAFLKLERRLSYGDTIISIYRKKVIK